MGQPRATLGELDRPDAALCAFERAAACDPASHQTVNNIGVVQRELGQLAESEASFRRVTELAPDLAFGYYNLGHTLFLQGRYQAALTAYVEGRSAIASRTRCRRRDWRCAGSGPATPGGDRRPVAGGQRTAEGLSSPAAGRHADYRPGAADASTGPRRVGSGQRVAFERARKTRMTDRRAASDDQGNRRPAAARRTQNRVSARIRRRTS